jgi:hypothetical protein
VADKIENQAKALGRLPKFKRFQYAAVLKVDENTGVAQVNHATRHVDYWLYKAFQPLTAIEKVWPIR